MRTFLTAFILAAAIAVVSSNVVSQGEWDLFTMKYKKIYPSVTAENNARFYYAVNKGRITDHNDRYNRKLESYQLAVNQFSDWRFLEFAALFRPTTEIRSNGVPLVLPPVTPQASFSYPAVGINSAIRNQTTDCNSGWAYAVTTALQIFKLTINPALNTPTLSAQNLIDCAGAAKSCINQVPQVAFDYLTTVPVPQKVYPETSYLTNPLGQGMCLMPTNQVGATTLASYSNIPNGNDAALMTVVNYAAPVVIKFNPGTFEFMHYKSGIFTQPAPTQTAAHYMTVIGYDTDTTLAKDYWLVQNSFGPDWGENGLIKIERNPAKPIANSAIFPNS